MSATKTSRLIRKPRWKVLDALGRDPAMAERAEVKTARLADAVSAEWAERYRAETRG